VHEPRDYFIFAIAARTRACKILQGVFLDVLTWSAAPDDDDALAGGCGRRARGVSSHLGDRALIDRHSIAIFAGSRANNDGPTSISRRTPDKFILLLHVLPFNRRRAELEEGVRFFFLNTE